MAASPGGTAVDRATVENLPHENRIAVAGLDLQVFEGGSGERLLLLHDYEYVNRWYSFLQALADQGFAVQAPSHPGFGASPLPTGFDSVDDFAYLYLDLLRQSGPATLVGLGLGGWIAAEIAIRCTHQVQALVLVDALGIKVSDRTTRDIVDTFVLGDDQILEQTWHDPAAGRERMSLPAIGTHTEEALVEMLRNRETAALVGWKPFMHNPKLRGRLARIDVPTLVLWGESDRLVQPDYGRAYAAAIPGAEFATLADAGHYPYLEQPEAFVQSVAQFVRARTGAPRR